MSNLGNPSTANRSNRAVAYATATGRALPSYFDLAVGPQLLSPGFILLNAVWGGILSFTLSNDIDSTQVAAHLLAVIAAQMLFSAILAWGYRWNSVRRRPWTNRQFFAVFIVAGAFRGALLQFLLTALQLTHQSNYIYRTIAGMASMGLSAWFWAILFGVVIEWRKQSGKLAAERNYLVQLQTEVDAQVSNATELEIQAFRSYLLTNLKLSDKADMAAVREELLAAISGVIRPVVEQMLSHRTAVSMPDDSAADDRVHIENVLKYVQVQRSIKPFIQVAPGIPAAITGAAVIYGYPGGIAAMVAYVGIWPAMSWLLKYTVAPLFDRLPTFGRVAGVLITSGLAVLPGVWVLSSLPTVGRGTWAPFQFTVFALVTSSVMATWFAYLEELARVYVVREQYLGHIHWKVAEVNSRRWHQQLYFARRVHGALQSEVTAVAIRLGQEIAAGKSGTSSVADIRENLEARVKQVFDGPSVASNPVEVLAEISETWDGICDIAVTMSATDATRMMSDPIAVDTALEIVREGISNAIRHGNAEQIAVSLCLKPETLLEVEVTNDGSPLEPSDREGLGTRHLQECSVTFRIDALEGKTRLVAEVPFRG